ncbi:MAG: FtsX-like permease family protein [Thermoleophilia bacterium]|nr:FtsX-like permease family protein [Thermoleophilia bacterium]
MLRRKLLRDLRRQKGQATAIAVTLFLGAALFAASYDAYRNLQASYARVFVDLRAADLTVVGGRGDSFGQAARTVEGVAAVETRTVADLPLRIGRSKLLGRVVGTAPDPDVNRLLLESGSRSGGALVEQHFAGDFDLQPGQTIEVLGLDGWQPLQIAGIVSSWEYLWPARSRQDVLPPPRSFGVVFVPEDEAAILAGANGMRETLVRFAPHADVAASTARFQRLALQFDATDTVTRADQPSNAALQTDIDGFRDLAVLFPLLFLAAAALATGVLLSRRVRAERSLIGMLRASGASRRALVAHYLSYGLVLGLAGGIAGAAAGEAAASAMTRVYTGELGIPLAVTQAHPGTAAVAAGFALAVGALGALAPALAASRVEPAEAMRGTPPSGRGGPSLAERFVPPLGRLPVRFRHVLRSISRSRRRSLSTVLGVVLALTLILVAWGMLDTTSVLLSRQFGDVDRQDADVRLDGPVSAGALRRIEAVTGVAAAEAATEVPVTLVSSHDRYATALRGFRPGTTMHGFADPSALERGVLLGRASRDLLQLGVGDPIALRLPGGQVDESRVSGFVDEPLGTYAYTSLERLVTLGFDPNQVLVRFAPGADTEATLAGLEELPDVAAVTDTRGLERLFNRYLGLFYAFVGTMLVFAATLAFVIMFTSMSANVAERSVEVTTLRANGVSHRQVAQLLRAENVLLTLAGIAVGLPVAWIVAREFMAAYSSDLFRFDLQLKPWTPALAGLCLVAVALLSELPALRALRRIDLGRTVRERAG